MTKNRPLPKERRQPPINKAIKLPPPPARQLTPAETGSVMKRARKLGRRGMLTPYDHRVLDALLFQCGCPLSGAVVVSYSALARITGMARATIIKGVTRLTGCGLLQRTKRRLRIAWHQGGTASLQAPNAYIFTVPRSSDTESAAQPVNLKLEISYMSQPIGEDVVAARTALAKLRKHMAQRARENQAARIAAARAEGRFVAC